MKEKKPHIKKPLNAFMLFMKEKRAEVIKQCTLKESAAINQILGKMVSVRDFSPVEIVRREKLMIFMELELYGGVLSFAE